MPISIEVNTVMITAPMKITASIGDTFQKPARMREVSEQSGDTSSRRTIDLTRRGNQISDGVNDDGRETGVGNPCERGSQHLLSSKQTKEY